MLAARWAPAAPAWCSCDGRPVHACLVFAVQADGASVETIEGLTDRGVIADLQAGLPHAATHCNAASARRACWSPPTELLAQAPAADAASEIRDALSGNYCRCTGYEAIVDAIEHGRPGARLATVEGTPA